MLKACNVILPPQTEQKQIADYLWKPVLCKDRLLEIIHKYLHLQVIKDEKTGDAKEEHMIFPGYNQLDVVTNLLDDVKGNGVEKNYLIQHNVG